MTEALEEQVKRSRRSAGREPGDSKGQVGTGGSRRRGQRRFRKGQEGRGETGFRQGEMHHAGNIGEACRGVWEAKLAGVR